jgi:hypothetical protein
MCLLCLPILRFCVSEGDEDCCGADSDAAGLDLLWQCASTQGEPCLVLFASWQHSCHMVAVRVMLAGLAKQQQHQQQQQWSTDTGCMLSNAS